MRTELIDPWDQTTQADDPTYRVYFWENGAGLGPWIGGYFGKWKAHQGGEYREELIKKRKSRPDPEQPSDG